MGANRHVDGSRYPLGADLPPHIVTAHDLVTTLAYRRDLLDRVSARCREVFDYGLAITLAPEQQVSLVATSPERRLSVTGMGSGFVQLTWVLVMLELAAMERDGGRPITPVIGIEEPELHRHPALQPQVARVLAHFLGAGLQVVCTTQSEHLLVAILTLVLSGQLEPGQVAISYLSEGRAERLEVNGRGQVTGGLRGFFEANEDELKRYLELLSRR
ncbi:MAG TPA: AAA family ATPase [Candidatus Dormibacteraeota bacterium]|nr:AAA family ATPase [Candidatus Dormibacteraeota bacterium]